jgi:superfamily II DNA or RNA helicase
MIQRFSSRKQRLDTSFLTPRLQGALAYDRIAGYFSLSLLEIAGEAIESMAGKARIVCNSQIDGHDMQGSRGACYAMRQDWCASQPEKLGENTSNRFSRLYVFLQSGKLAVRILPDKCFGLVHGKAGVITLANGLQTSFLGSVNESKSGWQLNYELLWEDDSAEAIAWVQKEFDSLWNDPLAYNLAEFVIEDVGRLSKRQVITTVPDWQAKPQEAPVVIETPVYRREYGLWEHQKYFVKLAFDAHRTPHGARLVLADMVGLGKTVQLALAAMMMALYGTRPILVLTPKNLLWQWQEEMKNLLDMPSAVWTGKEWIDENGIQHPVKGPEGIKNCPRRIGLISQGLIKRKSEAVEYLKELRYECIIVDEAHAARRKNLRPGCESEKPDPNNLFTFLCEVAPRTHSLLLATATPVQIHPIEAWDLLYILAQGNELVFGNKYSNWHQQRKETLELVMGHRELPEDDLELWNWICNPLPPSTESRDFLNLRRTLHMEDDKTVAAGRWAELKPPDQERVRHLRQGFARHHNPFIRHIIRRTREDLENTIDPETKEPYLKPVHVQLFGEGEEEAISLPPYLKSAYESAEEFCRLLGQRVRGAGFLKTLLLRRVGSSIYAGQLTAQKMLSTWHNIAAEEEEEDEFDETEIELARSLTEAERIQLQSFVRSLEANKERDPKYPVVKRYLLTEKWHEHGCIIFSQYFDSVWWLGQQLTQELPEEPIGLYAGGAKSGIIRNRDFTTCSRENLKLMVQSGKISILLGTDAASEGLNLQKLGTLINLDLPWNPTRLEQRKGRIQRIGQLRDTVLIYNMRYKDSVEDRVHLLLSKRLRNIHDIFGQIPDVLEDVWIDVAMGDIEEAQQIIDAVPEKHPFAIRYHGIKKTNWESCSQVLDAMERKKHLTQGW